MAPRLPRHINPIYARVIRLGLRKSTALIQTDRRAALQAGRGRYQQLRQQCQTKADCDHAGDFCQNATRWWVGIGLLLARGIGCVIGQPGMRAELNFLHVWTPATAWEAQEY